MLWVSLTKGDAHYLPDTVADELTAPEIADRLRANLTSVRQALDEMQIEGRRPWTDRRKVVYPQGTLERVRQWLEAHS
jgi:hypothetical protein